MADIFGNETNERLEGTNNNDFIFGAGGDDTLLGLDGDDTLDGGDGDDLIETGDATPNGDIVDGSTGNDIIDFSGNNGSTAFALLNYNQILEGITVTLNGAANTATVDKGLSGTDTIINVENPLFGGFNLGGLGLIGTTFNDVFDAAPAANQWMQVRGGDGVDNFVIGGDGLVRLDFAFTGAPNGVNIDLSTKTVIDDGFGNTETISGPSNVWEIRGTDNDDSIKGSDADESFITRQGDDTVDGGDGFDRLRFDRSVFDSGITVDFESGVATGYAQFTPFQVSFTGIEWLRGTNFGDVLTGDAGSQTLDGGTGNDTLTGGAGGDTFSLGNNSTLGTDGGVDIITDFEVGVDGFNFDGVDMTEAEIEAAFDAAVDTGNGAMVALANTTIFLKGVTAAEVQALNPFADAVASGGAGGGGGTGQLPGGGIREGGNGNDRLEGTDGQDTLIGNEGDDTLIGGGATEVLFGDDFLYGGPGDDLIIPGQNEGGFFGTDWIETGTGNDMIDLTGATRGYTGINYSFLNDIGETVAVTVNGATNTATIDKGAAGTDTILGVAIPLIEAVIGIGGGLSLRGTSGDDTFNITTDVDQWMSIRGNGGNDTYTLSGDSTIRLDFSFANGIVADLGAGTVDHGFGTDTIIGDVGTLRGSSGDDSILGSDSDEAFIGRSGSDTINGAGGIDLIRYDRGGTTSGVEIDVAAGTATGTFNNIGFTHNLINIEWFRGGQFDDVIIGDNNAQTIEGGGGQDTLTGGGGADTFLLGSQSFTAPNGGLDTITDFQIGVDQLDLSALDLTDEQISAAFVAAADTGQGAVIAFADDTAVIFEGLTAAEISALNPFPPGQEITTGDEGGTVEGGDGPDTITGGTGDDEIVGGLGDDSLSAGQGNDVVSGGLGNDLLGGGGGNDTLRGGLGDDTLNGGAGADSLVGQRGDDTLNGGGGDDRIKGGGGQDRLNGGNGDDFLKGGTSGDRLNGGSGNDSVLGNRGDDTLNGGQGDDLVNGGGNNDLLNGGAGNDFLKGGAGRDTLDGGAGNDLLEGSGGADTFVFSDGHGDDTIADFAARSNAEKIDLNAASAITGINDLRNNHATQEGADVLIDTGGGNSILLEGIVLSDLDRTDFIF